MHRSRPGFIPHQLSTHSVPTVEVLLADSIMAGSLEVFTGVEISWAMVAVAPLGEPQEAETPLSWSEQPLHLGFESAVSFVAKL